MASWQSDFAGEIMLEECGPLIVTGVPARVPKRVLTRRGLILLAGASLASWSRVYGGKEFWEAKDPAEWNSDDIARILSRSPWAKAASAARTSAGKNTMPSTSNPNTMPGTRSPRNSGGIGGIGGMGGAGSRMPSGSGGNRNPNRTVTTYKGTVIWESAAPVRAALRTRLPEAFEGQYVLGVTGVPLAKSDSKGALDRIRQITTLQAKGKQPLEAAVVQEDTTNGTVYLFGFSREAMTLSKDDQEVVFTTHMAKLAFTARFNLKDMLYHGELAV